MYLFTFGSVHCEMGVIIFILQMRKLKVFKEVRFHRSQASNSLTFRQITWAFGFLSYKVGVTAVLTQWLWWVFSKIMSVGAMPDTGAGTSWWYRGSTSTAPAPNSMSSPLCWGTSGACKKCKRNKDNGGACWHRAMFCPRNKLSEELRVFFCEY